MINSSQDFCPLISVVIPVRLSFPPLYDEIGRIDRICRTIPADDFAIIIVDYGSPPDRRRELAELQTRFKAVQIVWFEGGTEPFSIGHARDLGVQAAHTALVMFHDLDLLCETDTYRDIADEARLRRLDQNAYDFLCIPAIYLSSDGTESYLREHNRHRRLADRRAIAAAQQGDAPFIEHYAISTSTTLVSRHLYLASGGHDRAFIGHGAEDFEFYNRLTALAPRHDRPPGFSRNVDFAVSGWHGFRAYFALYGMELWMRGIAMVHLKHPRREDIDPEYRRYEQNFDVLRRRMDAPEPVSLLPMKDAHIGSITLVVASSEWLAISILRMALPLLGDYRVVSPDNVVVDAGVGQVLILNQDAATSSLMKKCAILGVRCLSLVEGDAPDKWHFAEAGDASPPISEGRSHRDDQGRLTRIDFSVIRGLNGSDVTLGAPRTYPSHSFLLRGVQPFSAEAAFTQLNILPLLRLGAGARRRDGAIVLSPGVLGHGLFGPYLTLPESYYVLEMRIEAEAARGPSSIALDIVLDGGKAVLAERRIRLTAEEQTITMAIEFGIPDLAGPFECRLWTDGARQLGVKKTHLSKCDMPNAALHGRKP